MGTPTGSPMEAGSSAIHDGAARRAKVVLHVFVPSRSRRFDWETLSFRRLAPL